MLQQRILYSRSFAAMRGRSRITRRLLAKRRNLREFLPGLAVIVLFVWAWMLGEMAGYLAGAAWIAWRVWSDQARVAAR